MWKIHRYYLKDLTVNALLAFCVMFGIVLMASLSKGIDRAQGGNLVSAVLITFYWAADTFPHLLAISLLIATVLTFARASQDREITALRAAGISPRVPMVSALIVGVFLAIGAAWAHHDLIPLAHYKKYRVVGPALREMITSTGLSDGKIAHGGFFLSASERDEHGRFRNVVIKLGRSSGQLEAGRAYLAQEAWLESSEDGERLFLRLRDIRDAMNNRLPGAMTVQVDIRALTEGRQRWAGDKDLSSSQLLANVERGLHENAGGAQFTVHRRACFAFMPALFAPIGFCIGVLARDRGRMTAVLFAMVPLIIFYASVMTAPTLVRIWHSPLWGWFPALTVGLFGVPFCWRLLRV